MKFSDLDPAAQRAIRSGRADKGAPRGRPRPSRAALPERDEASYGCRTCGLVLRGFARAERHVNAVHGGGTIRVWPPP